MPKAAAAPPTDAHEWVSFEDPEEERTWVFDVTFLTSRWTCIFGAGCQGVLTGPAPELVQGCCSYGAHFTDGEDVDRVLAAAQALTDEQWQFRRRAVGKDGTLKITKKVGAEVLSRQADDACIFLNRPGFPGGPGCALHRAAIERGQRPLELKPNVCWQLPLRREDTEGDDGHVTSTVRQWDRRHWGDGGAEFHWWCTEAPEAFIADDAVYRTLRDELIELTTPAAYAMVADYIESRPRGRWLPHPAVRPASGADRRSTEGTPCGP